jgi:hypothetical protein
MSSCCQPVLCATAQLPRHTLLPYRIWLCLCALRLHRSVRLELFTARYETRQLQVTQRFWRDAGQCEQGCAGISAMLTCVAPDDRTPSTSCATAASAPCATRRDISGSLHGFLRRRVCSAKHRKIVMVPIGSGHAICTASERLLFMGAFALAGSAAQGGQTTWTSRVLQWQCAQKSGRC